MLINGLDPWLVKHMIPHHEHKEVAVDSRLLDSYLGTHMLDDVVIAIAREGDRVLMQMRDRKILLSPESARDYALQGSDDHITFVSDGNARVKELNLA